MKIVVSCTSAVVDVRITVAFAFAPIVRLNAANGIFFEFVHM